MTYRRLTNLALMLGALSAGYAPGVAAQYRASGRPIRFGSPHFYAGFSAGPGNLRYVCELCGGNGPGTSTTFTGRFGFQFADGRVLAGFEGIHFTTSRERFTMLGASVSGLALQRHLMVGAGFGFAGYRFPTVFVSGDSLAILEGGWGTKWGYGAEAHVGVRVPFGHGLALTPQAGYARSLGGIVQYGVPLGKTSVLTGYTDFAVVYFGVGVLWRQR